MTTGGQGEVLLGHPSAVGIAQRCRARFCEIILTWTLFFCDLQGRKIRVTNSKTLVGWLVGWLVGVRYFRLSPM